MVEIVNGIEVKWCPKCSTYVSTSKFNICRSQKDGYTSYCAQCHIEYNRVWYLENTARKAAQGKEYRAANQDSIKVRQTKYNQAHKTEQSILNKRWYENNKERRKETCIEWAKNNKTKRRVYSLRRKAVKTNLEGSFTDEELTNLFITQSGRCSYCGESLLDYYEVDHIIPVTREGSTNFISNMQLTCKTCNRSKNNKLHEEYLEYLQKVDSTKYEKYLKHQDYIATKILLSDWRN